MCANGVGRDAAELLWAGCQEVILERKLLHHLHLETSFQHPCPSAFNSSLHSSNSYLPGALQKSWDHTSLNITDKEAGETAQKLRAFATLLEDPSSVPGSQTGQLTVVCNSSSWRFNVITGTFWNHRFCIVNIYSMLGILSLLLLLSLFPLLWHVSKDSWKFLWWTPCLSSKYRSNCQWFSQWHSMSESVHACPWLLLPTNSREESRTPPYDPAVHECDSSDNWWSKWGSDKDTDVTYFYTGSQKWNHKYQWQV